jgi:hypothetical protein
VLADGLAFGLLARFWGWTIPISLVSATRVVAAGLHRALAAVEFDTSHPPCLLHCEFAAIATVREQAMASSIKAFWRRLDGPVHPDDRPVFDQRRHTFNLDYPPPAFIGDIDHAPVVVLMANGGCDPKLTPTEFARPEDAVEFIEYLRGERQAFPSSLGSYYIASPFEPWLSGGKVVLVNAVAYRSPNLSQEPLNRRTAEMLPSVAAHRHWLHTELLAEASEGKRLVVAHRYRIWQLDRNQQMSNVLFSINPASAHLSWEMMATIEQWLAQRSAVS